MSLEEAVREAYEIAQTSTDPHPAPPVSFVRIPRP